MQKVEEFYVEFRKYYKKSEILRTIILCHPSNAFNFFCVFCFLIPVYLFFLFIIGLPVYYTYPDPAGTGISNTQFSEDRVRNLITELTVNGSRQVYSIQNLYSGDWIHSKAEEIIEENRQSWVRSRVFRLPFSLEGRTGIPESEPLCNILVEVTSDTVENNNTLMFMAHFDGMFNTPGASDNASGVGTLLELIRNLVSHSMAANFPVLFGFVNSEENGMFGSSAMYKYDRIGDVKRFINIDNMGGKGKAMMVKVAPSVLAREVGSISEIQGDQITISIMKQFPHFTDFGMLRKIGIPGFEFTQTQMSFEYHTDLDVEGNIVEGSIQLLGDALEQFYDVYIFNEEDSPLEENPEAESDNDYVFYNYMGNEYFWYSEKFSLVFSILFFFLITFILVSVFLGIDYSQFTIKPGESYFTEAFVSKEEMPGLWNHLFRKLFIIVVYAFSFTLSFLFAFGTAGLVGLIVSAGHLMAYQRSFTLSTVTMTLASLIGMLLPQYFTHLFFYYCFQMRPPPDIQDRYLAMYILVAILAVVFESFDVQLPSMFFYVFNFPAALIVVFVGLLVSRCGLKYFDTGKLEFVKQREEDGKLMDDLDKKEEETSTTGDYMDDLDDRKISHGGTEDMYGSLSMMHDDDGLSSGEEREEEEEEDLGSTTDDNAHTTDNSQKVEEEGEGNTTVEGSSSSSPEEDVASNSLDKTEDVVGGNLVSEEALEEGGDVNDGGDTDNGSDAKSDGALLKLAEETEDEDARRHSRQLMKQSIFRTIHCLGYFFFRKEKGCFMCVPFLMFIVSIFNMTTAYMIVTHSFPEFGRDRYVLPAVSFSFVCAYFTISVFTCLLPWFQRAANFTRVIGVLTVLLLFLVIATAVQFPYSVTQPKRLTLYIQTGVKEDISLAGMTIGEEKEVMASISPDGKGVLESMDSSKLTDVSDVFDYYYKETDYTSSDMDCDVGVCTFTLPNIEDDFNRVRKYQIRKTTASEYEVDIHYDQSSYVVIIVSDNVEVTWEDTRVVSKSKYPLHYFLVNVISDHVKGVFNVVQGSEFEIVINVHFCDDDAKPDFVSQMFELQDWMTLMGVDCGHDEMDDTSIVKKCRRCDFLQTENRLNFRSD